MFTGLIVVGIFIVASALAWWLDHRNLKSKLATAGIAVKPIVGKVLDEVETFASVAELEAKKFGGAVVKEVETLWPIISLAAIETDIQALKAKIAKAKSQQAAKAQAASASSAATQAALKTLTSYEQMVSAAPPLAAPAAPAPAATASATT